MRATGGSRLRWADIPVAVRAAIEQRIGSTVASAVTQDGGFSPGMAARCALADGSRVFVKAVSPAQNPQSCRIHRREAEIADRLPPDVSAPRLLHVHDDGEWVALVFEEIDGRQPAEPWTWRELDVIVPAVLDHARRHTPAPVADLQTFADRHRPTFDGFARFAAGDGEPGWLPSWVIDRIERLADIESGWEPRTEGDTLVHADLRADNILIDADRVVFVDWPWACRGASFLDVLLLLPSIGLGGGPPPAAVVDRYNLFAESGWEAVLPVAVALAGFFARASVDASPAGLPRLRSFQRAQAQVALDWLRPALG